MIEFLFPILSSTFAVVLAGVALYYRSRSVLYSKRLEVIAKNEESYITDKMSLQASITKYKSDINTKDQRLQRIEKENHNLKKESETID